MGYVRASCHQRSGHACFDVRLFKELKPEDLLSSCHADLLAARRAISKLLKSNILEIHLQLFAQVGFIVKCAEPGSVLEQSRDR